MYIVNIAQSTIRRDADTIVPILLKTDLHNALERLILDVTSNTNLRITSYAAEYYTMRPHPTRGIRI